MQKHQITQYRSVTSSRGWAFLLMALVMSTSMACTYAAAEETVLVEPAPLLTDAELKTLVGPVALYPDDLLAIVLPASTFPLQVVAAARFRADPANDDRQPDEDWDESVVALLNYPEALALLNDDIDWTWELGQAVVEQERALMDAVQAFRSEAYAAGNIDSDERQTVYVKDEAVVIEPAEEDIIYVPYYEPERVIVYQREPVYYYYPTAYPVYYYPYRRYHTYYDSGFWGLNSFFSLSWVHYNLLHYSHGHHHHRYHGRRYHDSHFRRTHGYIAPRNHHRRHAHRATYDYAYNGHWRPNRRHHGARPLSRHPHGVGRSDETPRKIRSRDQRRESPRRHIRRDGQHQYASLNTRREGFRDSRRGRSQAEGRQNLGGSAVHRQPDRETNRLGSAGGASSVHRPIAQPHNPRLNTHRRIEMGDVRRTDRTNERSRDGRPERDNAGNSDRRRDNERGQSGSRRDREQPATPPVRRPIMAATDSARTSKLPTRIQRGVPVTKPNRAQPRVEQPRIERMPSTVPRVQNRQPTIVRAEPRTPSRIERRAPAQIERRTSTRTERRAPTRVERQAPTRVERSAPARVQHQAPARVESRAPARVQRQAPARVERRTPARAERRAAPAASQRSERGRHTPDRRRIGVN